MMAIYTDGGYRDHRIQLVRRKPIVRKIEAPHLAKVIANSAQFAASILSEIASNVFPEHLHSATSLGSLC